MDCGKAKIFFLLTFFAFCQAAMGGTISGKITDENNEPLPFASVYISGTTQGVSSNKDGNYSIDLGIGKHELTFKYIGYKLHNETMKINSTDEKIILNVKMEPQLLEIKEVTVKADAEDPAYEVIRQAIKKRKFYLHQVEEFSCDIYIKGLQRMKSFPKKFMGMSVDAEGSIDTTSGIFYLSESVEKYFFKEPDKVKEEMISSKVSGNSKAFSFNRASDLMLNFYENLVPLKVVSQRGFVSPIANDALFYYKYHLLGTFFENGQMINKIEVIPKREHDPAFRGIIYIVEKSWRIHSADLFLVRDAGIQFIDTLRINQIHLPVKPESEVWEIFSNKLSFTFAIFAFKGSGVYLGIHSNYNIEPHFEKNFFGAEIMKVDDKANKKDSSYWQTARPVPLTAEEKKDYHKKDSVEVIHNSQKFLDSIDKKTNKFHAIDLLFGYSHTNRYKKREISFSPLIENISFNTVQGWVGGLELDVTKKYELEKRFVKKIFASYGFSNQTWNGAAELNYHYNPKKFASAEIRGGLQTVQFFSPNAASFRENQSLPISPFINSLYSLLDERNYAKFYQKKFLELAHSSEIVNGFFLKAALEYSDRSPLMNTTNYSFVHKTNSTYTANDPLNLKNDSATSFSQNQLFELSVNARIRFGQKYVTRPDEKWISGSKYPSIYIKYRLAIPNVFGSSMNYNFVKLSVTDRMDFKLLGKSQYIVSAGKFLSAKNVSFMDYNHFFGNQTVYSNFTFTSFQQLDYYAYSTKDYFIEAHYEHDFSGFILNKFPLLRKLKLNELAGVHYLYTEKLPNYCEVFVGLEKLRAVRVDFVTAFQNGKQTMTGFRFGLEIGR